MSERITIKSQREIELMRAAGAVVRDTLLLLEKSAAIGMTTEELNKIAEDFIRSQGAIPSFLNYEGYPKSICTSVNEQVVHGIPGGYKLKDGDIISVDVGAILNGYHGDAARTILIGNVKDEVKQLVEVTRECFFRGMEQAVAGNHIADIGAAVEQCAHDHGYGVVRELVGHGIGTSMHEPPEVPNFVDKRHGRWHGGRGGAQGRMDGCDARREARRPLRKHRCDNRKREARNTDALRCSRWLELKRRAA